MGWPRSSWRDTQCTAGRNMCWGQGRVAGGVYLFSVFCRGLSPGHTFNEEVGREACHPHSATLHCAGCWVRQGQRRRKKSQVFRLSLVEELVTQVREVLWGQQDSEQRSTSACGCSGAGLLAKAQEPGSPVKAEPHPGLPVQDRGRSWKR